MNRQRIRRYPGLHYFTTEQKAQFFGREEEEAALLALALTEKIVALFGKSGYGKSSLLRAGLIPRLPPDWLPIVVQLGAYQSGQSPTPLARTRAQLDAVLPEDTPETAFLEQISADTLWRRFRRKQDPEKRTVLLLFDQFEEFQTYPADQREEFKKQLAELLYTRIPQAVRDAADDLPDAQQAILARPNEVKALFALREDRLSVLDGLADKLPAILHKRYHLKGLDDAHAQEAILQPAGLPQGDRYESPPFRYTAGALSAIKRGLKKDEQDTTIESFLLQICCEEIERGVIERAGAGAGDIEVAERDLPVFEELFEQYYRNKIAALPDDTQRAAARRMMEDHLVKTDPGSGIAYRISADGRALRALPGVDEALLKRLTDVFLLRSEPNTTGDFSYEVSHDRLVEGILAMKQEYEAEEAEKRREQERIEAERRAREAEEKAAEERRRAEAAEQLQKEAEKQRAIAQESEARAQARTRLALLISLVAVALAVFAGWSYMRAEQEKAATEAQRSIAETKTREAESNLQLADDNLKKAQAEEARAKAALAQVEQEKAATEEQRRIAEGNLEKAKRAREEAEKQKTIAQETLDNLNKANEDFVRRFLENARKDMEDGRMDDAYDKIQTAGELNVLKSEVCKAYLANADSCLLEPDSAAYELAKKSVEAAAVLNTASLEDIRTSHLRIYESAIEKGKTGVAVDMVKFINEKYPLSGDRISKLYTRAAENYIPNLEYDVAVKFLQDSEVLKKIPLDTIKNLYLELAFWYTESGNTQRAASILDTLTAGAGLAVVRPLLRNLPSDTVAAVRRLQAVIQKIDGGRYARLRERYYPVMVDIPGGSATIGADTFIAYGDTISYPPFVVRVQNFQLARTEITVWQFALFCAATGREFRKNWPNSGDNPVAGVSWYDAVEYANWLSRQQALAEYYAIDKSLQDTLNTSEWDDLKWTVRPLSTDGYRLPTEAEWEYASRGGTDWKFAGCNTAEELGDYAWYDENSGGRIRGVGLKKPNPFGLYDMSGNVWEWCWDWYGYYPAAADNYSGPPGGERRVLRGGSYNDNGYFCRSAYRFRIYTDDWYFNFGFRPARHFK